jgi:uncharacterized protein YndB with AHSA1/START domain
VPEHFARWFAPHGAEVPLCEMDARPGGELRFHHRFPMGELVSIKGVFDEVVAPSRLRFTFTFVGADDQPDRAAAATGLAGRRTHRADRRTVRDPARHAHDGSPSSRGAQAAGTPSVVRHRELAGEGWRQTAERLVEYLERRNTQWPG